MLCCSETSPFQLLTFQFTPYTKESRTAQESCGNLWESLQKYSGAMLNPRGFWEAGTGRKGIPVRRGMTEQDKEGGWHVQGKAKTSHCLKSSSYKEKVEDTFINLVRIYREDLQKFMRWMLKALGQGKHTQCFGTRDLTSTSRLELWMKDWQSTEEVSAGAWNEDLSQSAGHKNLKRRNI